MNSTTASRAAALVGKLRRWYISFFSVAKNDSATALSWQLPVRLHDRRTSLSRAHSASSRLVYWAPRSELNRFLFSSDQGWHYQHAEYVKALKKAGWVQSMSRKGCCSDNSACEGFFGRLKNEFFYNHDFSGYTPEAFMDALGSWIDWHNERRIKESLGYSAPVAYREEWERRRSPRAASPKAA